MVYLNVSMVDQNIVAFGYKQVLEFCWYCYFKFVKNDDLFNHVPRSISPHPRGEMDLLSKIKILMA